MTNYTQQQSLGFVRPKFILLAGLAFLIAGIGIRSFYGMHGLLDLETGKAKNLVIGNEENAGPVQSPADLGFMITLDSVRVHPHISEYEIEVWKQDTSSANPHSQVGSPSKLLVDRFSPEKMKIRNIEKSDFHFRLKEFYPNFQFSYEYPSVRDTIEPKDPGITLELKTKEGTPIVTLLADPPNKRKVGDVVSLGASLTFYRQISADSIRQMMDSGSVPENRIVFSGADTTIYFMLDGSIDTQPLRENSFYNMPGSDSIGFTVMYCFPDAAYLKAVPSTKGSELLNPVAHLEIWKSGEGSVDAFVYPQTRVRKSGEFEIPGSDYKIGLGISREKAKKYCDCSISIQKKGSTDTETLSFFSGKSQNYKGYRFSPQDCQGGVQGKVTVEIVYNPGKIFIILGFILVGIASFLAFLSKKPAIPD